MKYLRYFILYLTGHTQVTMQREIKIFWRFAQSIELIQIMAVIFLESDHAIILKALCYACLPNIFFIEQVGFAFLISYIVLVIMYLWSLIAIVFLAIIKDHYLFKTQKIRNKKMMREGNHNQEINILNNSYNKDFKEYFLMKQLTGCNNGSWIEVVSEKCAYNLNFYCHIFYLPILYSYFIIVYRYYKQPDSAFNATIYALNQIMLISAMIILIISLTQQQSFRCKDDNFLRLHASFLFKFLQIIKGIPVMVKILQRIHNYQVTWINEFTIGFTVALYLIDYLDYRETIPYVRESKVATYNTVLSICIVACLFQQFEEQTLYLITLIISPCLARTLIQFYEYEFNQIINYTLQVEIKNSKVEQSRKQNNQTHNKSFQTLNSQIFQTNLIEKEIDKQKQQLLTNLKTVNNKYFLQFVRMYQILQIDTQQVLQTNESMDRKKSKFLMICLILIKTHIDQCSNLYCFCRGLRGEKRKPLESNTQIMRMRICEDIERQGIIFSTDLINRYIRSYIKLILNIQTFKANPNLCLISQLFIPLCQSDECFQSMILIMELKQSFKEQNRRYSKNIMALIISYAKYSVLERFKFVIKSSEIDKTLSYEDFRTTELLTNDLEQKIFQQAEIKINFLLKLQKTDWTFDQINCKLIQNVQISNKLEKELNLFYESSACRTSCLLLLFFLKEIKCDYYKFIHLKATLITKEVKFFERGIKNNDHLQICYLKVNLTRFSKSLQRGEVLGHSNNTPEFFGYSRKDFRNYITTIEKLCPPQILRQHNSLVEMFLQTNKPNILRTGRMVQAQRDNCEIIYVEIFIDLCFLITDTELPVYCFLKELRDGVDFENIKGHIILNNHCYIASISRLALQQFQMSDSKYFIEKHIDEIFPNFNQYLTDLNQKLAEFQDEEQRQFLLQNEYQATDHNYGYKHIQVTYEDQQITIDNQEYICSYAIDLCYGVFDGQISKYYIVEFTRIYQAEIISEREPSNKSYKINKLNKSDGTISLGDFLKLEERPENEKNNEVKVIEIPLIELATNILSPNVEKLPLNKQESEQYQEMGSPEARIESLPSSRKSDQKYKLIEKAQDFNTYIQLSKNLSLVTSIDVINTNILICIFVIIMSMQQSFKDQTDSIYPTMQILQAFVSTDYINNLELSLTYDQYIHYDNNNTYFIQQIHRLLDLDTRNYLHIQQQYLGDKNIQSIFSETYINSTRGNQSAWNTVFIILHHQFKYLNFTKESLQGSIIGQLNDFQYYNEAYYKINSRFYELVTASINRFNDKQTQSLIFLCLVHLFILLAVLFVYFHFDRLINKYCRSIEQVTMEQIESEQNYLNSLIKSKQEFNIYQIKLDIEYPTEQQKQKSSFRLSNQVQIQTQSNQSNKKFIKLNHQFNLFKFLWYLLPITNLLIFLITVILGYFSIQNMLDSIQTEIELYYQSIQFEQSFSLLAFCAYVLENQKELLQYGYIDQSDLNYYISSMSLTVEQCYLYNNYLRSTVTQQGLAFNLLNSNFCHIFTYKIDQELCNQVSIGLLQRGILEASQTYTVRYYENYISNFTKALIDPTLPEDVITINYIIKGIIYCVRLQKNNINQDIDSKYQNNNLWYVIPGLVCILVQLAFIIYQYYHSRNQIYLLKQSMYLLPRDTLYLEDSFRKTLVYMQKIENNFIQ